MERDASRRLVGGEPSSTRSAESAIGQAVGRAAVIIGMAMSGMAVETVMRVASVSRNAGPQLVALQQPDSELTDPSLAAAWLRQHGFAAQNPKLAASGRNPLKRITAAKAKTRRMVDTNYCRYSRIPNGGRAHRSE